jgi:predicted ester cyclase
VDHGPTGDVEGREAFKETIARRRQAVPDLHCTVDNVVADADLVAWVVLASGTHTGDALGFPATGKRFETVAANIGRLRDGKAVEHWSEQGLFTMLQQLGVVPAMAAS